MPCPAPPDGWWTQPTSPNTHQSRKHFHRAHLPGDRVPPEALLVALVPLLDMSTIWRFPQCSAPRMVNRQARRLGLSPWLQFHMVAWSVVAVLHRCLHIGQDHRQHRRDPLQDLHPQALEKEIVLDVSEIMQTDPEMVPTAMLTITLRYLNDCFRWKPTSGTQHKNLSGWHKNNLRT